MTHRCKHDEPVVPSQSRTFRLNLAYYPDACDDKNDDHGDDAAGDNLWSIGVPWPWIRRLYCMSASTCIQMSATGKFLEALHYQQITFVDRRSAHER